MSGRPSRRLRSRQRSARDRRGFTLIELLVVVLIIGLLVAIAAVMSIRSMHRSRQGRAMEDLRQMGQVVTVHATHAERLPATLAEATRQTWLDPWGHDYVYSSDGQGYEIRCLGRDGRPSAGITPETRDQFDLDIVYANGQFANQPF